MFGVDPNQNQNGYGDTTSGHFVTSSNAAPYQGSFMTPQLPPQQQQHQQQLPSTQTFQTQLPNAQQHHHQQQQQQQTVQPAQVASPEPVKQKPPLPEEFIYLQTVLNELRTQCSNSTANPVSINVHKSKLTCERTTKL